jgi:peptide/nickel transport system substrate-binding protein
MHRALITGLVLFILCFPGCGSKKQTAATMEDGPAIDFVALQKKAACFRADVGTYGGAIVLSSFSDPKSFNPITSTETTTSEFTRYMYEGLVRINGVTLMPEPGIADTWEISDSGLTWTFHIRDSILWSDSTPFSAYDVEFTFNELIYNNDINPNSSRDMFLIGGKKIDVRALDSSHVRFSLPVPFAPFLRAMAQEILPKHKYAKVVREKKFSTALGIQTPAVDMVGTGPFLLESYISSQKVVFKRNPLFWQSDSAGNRLPYLDRVIYMIVADQNAEVLRFQRAEIDFLAARGQDYPSLKQGEEQGGYTVYRLGPATGSNFLFFNQNRGCDKKTGKPFVDPKKLEWFSNANFRRAVAFAIDKDNLVRAIMNGLGYPQWSPMTPSEGYFYCGDVAQYPYTPEKALELLAAEGYKDTNADGILEDKNGNQVEFSFITNSGNNVRIKIAEILRKDLEQLGFKVHFQQIEFNSLVQKIDNPPFAWDAILLGLTGGVEPHFGKNVWHSGSSLHMWYPLQKEPATPWEAVIDSLFDAGVRELDTAKRKEIYDHWQKIAADELPLIYTVLPERILCIANKFSNVNPSLNGGLLHNLEQIYLKNGR